MLPPNRWIPLIATGVMMAAHRLLMRGEPKEARTPLWKWSVVMLAGLLTIFLLASLYHRALPLLVCVVMAVAGSVVLGAAGWYAQRRLEDANGGWR
jgi:hypothetical protein